ncbi:MAG: hypothetical protein ACNI3A_12275 [Desulfovibrio sp.]|uniref:hypothetical protein n=1 Tax=Desulfovibrio sp. 7SRBS1 TaxID=3378064 RepID=UPI003B4041D8
METATSRALAQTAPPLSDRVRGRRRLSRTSEANVRGQANPPATFHKALQTVWTIQSLFLQKENLCRPRLGRSGRGMPACRFDDAHIRMMPRKGFGSHIGFEETQDDDQKGPVVPKKSGRIQQRTTGGILQRPVANVLTSRRFLPSHGSQDGSQDGSQVGLDIPDTGGLEHFATYEALEAAVTGAVRTEAHGAQADAFFIEPCKEIQNKPSAEHL